MRKGTEVYLRDGRGLNDLPKNQQETARLLCAVIDEAMQGMHAVFEDCHITIVIRHVHGKHKPVIASSEESISDMHTIALALEAAVADVNGSAT